jgi:hypothetical protein
VGYATVVLAAAAGLNPRLPLLMVAGLATFTRHAPLTPAFTGLLGWRLLAVLALLLLADVVASKVPRLARPMERTALFTAAASGAVLGLALPNALLEVAPAVAAATGALVAVGAQLGRQRLARSLDRPLQGLGHVMAGVFADLAAGTVSAATFALVA